MSRLPPLAALAAPCGRVESSAERQPASRQQFGAILVTLRHLRAALSALHPSRQALRRSRMLCSIAHRRWRAWSVWLRRTIVRFCAPTALRRALLLIGGLCAVIDVSCVSGLSVKVTHTYTWYGTVYDKNALHCTPKVGHGAHKPRTVLSRATARRKRAAAQDTSSTADRRDTVRDSRESTPGNASAAQAGISAHGSRGSSRGYYAARPSDSRSARQPGAPGTARGCRHRRCRRRPPPRRAGLCGGAVSCGPCPSTRLAPSHGNPGGRRRRPERPEQAADPAAHGAALGALCHCREGRPGPLYLRPRGVHSGS